MNPNPLAIGLLTTLALACCATGKVIYVDDDAVGANDGTSWADAYVWLQDALADANDSERPVEIRVARGIYRPDQRTGIESGDKEATFRMFDAVRIRGGYAGLGHADPNAWNPSLHETILWGDLQDNDDFTDNETLYDNSRHIVTADGANATAVLEGVTITHGAYFAPFYRDGSNEPEGGAGIHNRAGSPTILRCVFSHNRVERARGAAILNCKGAAPRLEQCTFRENYGRSVLCDHESTPVLTNCRFIENYGVVVREYVSRPQFENCSFIDNLATPLALEDGSYATMSNCTFTGNYSAISGDSVRCVDCVFTGNRADLAAGAVTIADGTFIRCSFRENSTSNRGGAIAGKKLRLEDCTFVRNSAEWVGAISCEQADINACLFAGNQAGTVGALSITTRATLTNCTIAGNRSLDWGAIDIRFAEAVVTNCIIRDNPCRDASFDEIIYGDTTVSFSCVEASPYPIKGIGRIDVDPGFVKAGHWDPNGTPDDPNDDFWVDGDYHLKSQAGQWDPVSQAWVQDDVTSPCVDAGDPNSPVGHEPFPNGGRINMGAYGGTVEASKSPSGLHSRYGGGTGEADDPYLIYTAEQISAIGAHPEDWDKHFKLMADIDLGAQAAAEFDIIGRFDDSESFNGTFDGSGHTISNFTYASPNTNGVGLFGYVGRDSAEIRNLTLIDPNVDAGTGDYAGALVGYLGRGSVVRCRVEGAGVQGDEAVGGLVGYNWAGVVVECSTAGAVAGRGDIGGLVGGNQSGTIADCRATATVAGESDVGGLVGDTWGGTILTCRSSGSVSGRIDVGGLVGDNAAAIADCYSTARVAAAPYSESVGGLVGENTPGQGTIENCYAAGLVTAGTGSTYVGGLVGDNGGTVHSAFWDMEASGQTTSAAGTGKTTAEMQTAGTFLDAGWDFIDETENGTEDIWWIREGHDYPRLFWESGDEAP